jgi:hypothetical protein
LNILNISQYNKEQLDTSILIKDYIESRSFLQKEALRNQLKDYLIFRDNAALFFEDNFSNICHQKCYKNSVSACCTREGIITFFADMVINMMVSTPNQINNILKKLKSPQKDNKCVYLEKTGCIWQIKPIVCEMFLCEPAKKQVFFQKPRLKKEWEMLKLQEKQFKWPDKPVLFDELETIFISDGFSSPLMYFHNTPGLLRIKKLSMSKS